MYVPAKPKKITASHKKIARLLLEGVLDCDWYIVDPNHNQNSLKKAAVKIVDYLERKGVEITP